MKTIGQKFTEIIKELPIYCIHFFTAKDDVYMPKTRLAYAGDLRVFFYYLLDTMPDRFPYDKISQITTQDLENLTPDDINLFLMYLGEYQMPNPDTGKMEVFQNSPSGKKRKLATLKSFYKWLNVEGRIQKNPTVYIATPKIREKEIFILSEKEKDKMLNKAETGNGKSGRSLKFHEKSKYRDIAILSLFLGTGIRVSELVSIDLFDMDFEEQRILITRKGGKREFVYFNNTVLSALADYMDLERNQLRKSDPESGKEDGPLFVSNRGTRITVSRVEQLVKEYARFVLPPNLKATPHTLRKTFGTEVYQKYRDIYLTQHALGHASSATTTKYYAKFDPDLLKQLRDDSH